MPWMHPPFDLTPLRVPDESEITYLALGWLHCDSPDEGVITPPTHQNGDEHAEKGADAPNDQQRQEEDAGNGEVVNVDAPRHPQRQQKPPKQEHSRIDKWRNRGRH